MPELTLDVAVANRFISSLSKSLQALCHGCMDFDSGIEIVGYINVNIDKGSKVDYVLNEKVLKSTTNSMTFVSNSFLAKKEQPRQTRDGSCSPVLELQSSLPSSHSRFRGAYYPGSQHHKSMSPFSAHSHVLRGSQKRAWSGVERDWRSSAKRHIRGGRPQYPFSQDQSFSGASSHYSMSEVAASSQSAEDTNFKQPENPIPGTSLDSDSHLGVNIKKELIDSDETTLGAQTDSDYSQTSFKPTTENNEDNLDTKEISSEDSEKINIKNDPDAVINESVDTSESGVNDPNIADSTFLKPASSEDTLQDDQSTSELVPGETTSNDNEIPSFGTPFPESGERDGQNSVNEGQGSNFGNVDDGNTGAENVASGSDMPVEYDDATDDAYPQTSYSDVGEGSGDGSQFEVIEIEDEDEDVEAMFGDPQIKFADDRRLGSHGFVHRPSAPLAYLSNPTLYSNEFDPIQCPHCPVVSPVMTMHKQHLSQCHGQEMPFSCSECGRGFFSYSGLTHHKKIHSGRKFQCNFCESKFLLKHHLKAHLKRIHKLDL